MKKQILTLLALLILPLVMQAKTLVAYYSYTNNVERIVNALRQQITCDVVEIEPAEKGLDYAANNYALGTQLLSAIRNNPNDASSYPAIDPVEVNMNDYDMVIIAAPLWWSQMAAPFQTFLFHYGPQMAGKNIGIIVSSASSGISGVVADAKRLIPGGNFIEPNLWIRSSQTPNAASLITKWLSDIHYDQLTSTITSVENDKDLGFILSEDTLSVSEDVTELALYNLSGYIVLGTNENTLDISGLHPGVYTIRLNKSNNLKTAKIAIR